MDGRGWLKYCLVALVFAAGVSAGSILRRSGSVAPSVPNQPTLVDPSPFPMEASIEAAEGWAPEHPLIGIVESIDDDGALGDWTVVPSTAETDDDLHPPEIALHVRLAGGPVGSTKPNGEGPQLHPPDAPRPPDVPTRTAENDPSSAPERLPLPEGVSRVPPPQNDRRDARLRSLIEEVLPEATEPEQEVWLEELRGLNPGVARHLLELRRKLGAVRDHEVGKDDDGNPRRIDDDRANDLANRPGRLPPAEWPRERGEEEMLPPMPVEADPLSDESVITRPLESAMAALRQARGIIVHNIANARTTGFKRTIVEFTERSSILVREGEEEGDDGQPDASFGQGTSLRTRFDFEQGPFRETGRSLDVAIDGTGWLQLKVLEGAAQCYTRCGQLQINRDRSLGIRLAGRTFRLEPKVAIPAGATEVDIGEDGTVEAIAAGEDEPQPVGKISLVKFATNDVLVPCGGGVYKVGGEEVSPIAGTPGESGLGTLHSGSLEGSNVDIKSELAELQQLKSLSRGLMEAVRLMRDDLDEMGDQETAGCGYSRACDGESCSLSKSGCRSPQGCCERGAATCCAGREYGCCEGGRCSSKGRSDCKNSGCRESCDEDCCEKGRCESGSSPCCGKLTKSAAANAECPRDNCPEK